ncbi:MAG: oligoendopeptidase [Solirubrobacteraceae bacterium]|jgi:oligoendopeptidase F|nr:oligoendopeptidase [Solirubrobacteraceae bacterium]
MNADAQATAPLRDDVQDVAWDLSALVDGDGRTGVDALLDEAHARAQGFAESYAGQVVTLDAAGLQEAVAELAAIWELVHRAGSYAFLLFATDTADPKRGALLQAMQERATVIETKLLFFELEWVALDDDRAAELLAADGLDFARHYLEVQRRYRPHRLTEPEERILSEKALASRSAWERLHSELVSAIRVPVGDDDRSLDEALSRLSSPDREERKTVAEAVTVALEPGLRTRGFIFNTLLSEKAIEDRLRAFPHWLADRNLANEASDDSVRALVDAVRGRYDIAQRWYRLKAQLLGIERLADYDRSAPISEKDETVEWPVARDLVLEAYASFSPDLERLARRFFEEHWIDAPPRPGKRGGAFSHSTVPSAHPYVMLNYTARRRDVLVMAHELGHGVHQALSAPQGILQAHTPLTMAETASVFGETVTFGLLLERTTDPESRLALLAESVEGSIATVFRQIAMHSYEDLVHTGRREEGELSVERLSELWGQTQDELFGGAVEVTEGYRSWWSYIPHFIGSPGYVYAYAYGQLLALSVYRRYQEEGAAFVPDYLRMLEAGGSVSPEELGKIVGVDLIDPGFWDSGLDLVEEQLTAAEEAARAARGLG